MNSKIFLMLALSCSFVLINCQNDSNVYQVTEEAQLVGGQCYCSDVCGPREIKSDDTPYWKNGHYFCKPRDEANYLPHGCNVKDALLFNGQNIPLQ